MRVEVMAIAVSTVGRVSSDRPLHPLLRSAVGGLQPQHQLGIDASVACADMSTIKTDLRGHTIRPRTPTPSMIVLSIAAGLGALAFVAAFLVADRIPPEGDARLEAFLTGLTSTGATALGVAVALASVLWALRLEDARRARRAFNEQQAELVAEADSWLLGVVRTFGDLLQLQEEAANTTDSVRRQQLNERARDLMQRFYDEGQNLDRVELLAQLIEDSQVSDCLEKADGRLRLWNETVAGDHTTRQVNLSQGDVWSTYGDLYPLRDTVREQLVEHLRTMHLA